MRPALLGLGLVAAGVLAADVRRAARADASSVDGLGRHHRARHADARHRHRPRQRARARSRSGSCRRRQRAARARPPGVPARRGILGSGVHETTLTPTLGANGPGSGGQGDARGARVRPFAVLGAAPRAARHAAGHGRRHAADARGCRRRPRRPARRQRARHLPRRHRRGVERRPGGRPLLPRVLRRLQRPDAARRALRGSRTTRPTPRPVAVATDAAGNRARGRRSTITVQPRKFAEKTLPITDAFLQRKVPELLQRQRPADRRRPGRRLPPDQPRPPQVRPKPRIRDLPRAARPAAALFRRRRRRCCACPAPRCRASPTAARYTHDGKVIDHQTHLGYDLASLKPAPVPAAAAGRVVFAGPLGIYGNAVILDHGLGLLHALRPPERDRRRRRAPR